MTEEIDFKPDWISAPGDTIADLLEERRLSLQEFAGKLGKTTTYAQKLIEGQISISAELAELLHLTLGASPEFWKSREIQYREDLARFEPLAAIEWLNEIPVKDLVKFKWVNPFQDKQKQASECLAFFGVPSVAAWRQYFCSPQRMAAFRQSPSFVSNSGSVAAWLRKGQLEGEAIDCEPWDAKIFADTLIELRSLTRQKDPAVFLPELERQCAACGVAVVVLRAPTGCRASGATRFLDPSKALIMLSFRHLSDDHFWFTFFHEAGHLLLHGMDSLFLESGDTEFSKEEQEANEFSARLLIPKEFQAELLKLGNDEREIMRFARKIGISSGIVVGQLQHLGKVKPNHFNSLKRRFSWGE